MSRTTAPAHTALRQMWDNLNNERTMRNLKPLSYTHLAECAGSSKAIPGEPVTVSKSTVAAIMAGRYNSATASAIAKRLAECIRTWHKDLGIAFPGTAPARKKPARKPTAPVKITRCTNQGYVEYRGNTYYLGSLFAGEICTVSPLRDRSKGIRATTTCRSRLAYPVSAEGNQLGYKVANS